MSGWVLVLDASRIPEFPLRTVKEAGGMSSCHMCGLQWPAPVTYSMWWSPVCAIIGVTEHHGCSLTA
jgi:hypothetical protein